MTRRDNATTPEQIEAEVQRIMALPYDEQVLVIVAMIETLPPDHRAFVMKIIEMEE